MAEQQVSIEDIKLDEAQLVKEEVVTDRRVGTIRVLTPILVTGEVDPQREVIYLGEAQIMTQAGPLPIAFEIQAKSLQEAINQYGTAAKQGIQDTVERIRQMQRDAANQIVTPGMPGFQAPPSNPSGLVMP